MTLFKDLFSSESVSAGHPDKLADQISDSVLDAFLTRDPNARVACETLLADQTVVVAGEFKTSKEVFSTVSDSVSNLVRDVLRRAGYGDARYDIDPDKIELQLRLGVQSPDISMGVDQKSGIIGAGDQGLMFGYACDETPELMPAALAISHALMRRQASLVASGSLLRPDAKSQITLAYRADQSIDRVHTVVLSTQHTEQASTEQVQALVRDEIISPVLDHYGYALPDAQHILINPTGRFVTGGPKGDCGLTGRKIIVDTYGGAAPHGGGAFSGKDPTKVDRCAAYMARFVAKQAVASKLAKRCLIQVAYAIGRPHPVSISFDITPAAGVSEAQIKSLEQHLRQKFDFSVAGIIETLNLCRPIYAQTAAGGHFGRPDLQLPWEQIVI